MIVQNSKFHDIASSAIRLDGNENITEFCEFFRCVSESDDQGAIDMWGFPTYSGNTIHNNIFYEVAYIILDPFKYTAKKKTPSIKTFLSTMILPYTLAHGVVPFETAI